MKSVVKNDTSKKLLDMDLMYPIVIKKTKTRIKTISRDLPSYAGLKQRRPLLVIQKQPPEVFCEKRCS